MKKFAFFLNNAEDLRFSCFIIFDYYIKGRLCDLKFPKNQSKVIAFFNPLHNVKLRQRTEFPQITLLDYCQGDQNPQRKSGEIKF